MKRTLLSLVLLLAASTSALAGPAGPVNLGSGNLAYTIPLFAIGQDPLSLAFTLTYHSRDVQEPSLISWPLGVGWTHSFNQALVARDDAGAVLYHVNESGEETDFLLSDVGLWKAASPVSERGAVTLVTDATKCTHLPANQCYVLTDLQGTRTWFDYDGTTAGRWHRTEDRWGNALKATYTGTNLTVITDSVGRVVTLSYDGSNHLTGVLLAPQGQTGPTWTLGYTSGRLESIRDPLHTSTSWRAFSYVMDSQNVQRLLSTVKDDGPYLLDGFEYLNDQVAWQNAEGTSHAVHYEYGAINATNPKTRVTTVTRKQTASVELVTTYALEYRGGRWLATTIQGGCSSCGAGGSDKVVYTYDPTNLRPATKTVGLDLSGSGGTDERSQAQYTYDANGMLLMRKEAFGKTEERTTTYDYAYASGTPGTPTGGPPWPSFVTKVEEASVAKPTENKRTTYTWSATSPPETSLQAKTSGYKLAGDPARTELTTTTAFDALHRRSSVTGPATNQKTTFAYFDDSAALNDRRRLKIVSVYTSAAGHLDTGHSDYDIFGTAKKVVDPNLVETARVTDDVGRVTSVTSKAVAGDPNEASNYTTTYEYDLRDRLVKVTHPLGNQVQYVYENGTNRLTDTIRADSSDNQRERLHLTLNVIGGKTAEAAQSCDDVTPSSACSSWVTKRSETFEYNTSNRLSSVIHPGSPTPHIDYTYDSRGNVKTVKDERHTTANTTHTYDFLNRLKSVAQVLAGAPGGQIATGYEYDTQDNLKKVTDPNNNVTTYEYDDFRSLRKQISPVTGTTSYDYDAAGNLTSSIDNRLAGTTRTYDAASRLLTSVSSLTGRSDETVSYGYDGGDPRTYPAGRAISMKDPTGRTLYTYDRRGLVKSERKSVLSATYDMSYGYDANGNRTGITYPSGHEVTYAFDFADRPLTADRGATSYVKSAQYLPFGPLQNLTLGNDLARQMTYDLRYLPATLKLMNGSTSIAEYTYVPDAAGNLSSITDNKSGAYSRSSMRYDDLNRLTNANTGTSLWGTGTYTYDSMGNVLSTSIGATRSVGFTYLMSGANRLPLLASVNENGSPRAVTYDLNGNEATLGTTQTFAYSPRNYLQSALDRGTSDDGFFYLYDGRGLRTTTIETKVGVSIVVTNVSPGSAPSASPPIQITVDGFPFAPSSTVYIRDTALTTTYVSPTRLTATVSPAGLTAGAYYYITVRQGAAVSNAFSFLVDFLDVPPTSGYYPYVNTLLYHGITSGCGGGNFCPWTSLSRAQMAVFIIAADSPSGYVPPACVTPVFTDVACGSFAADFINEFAARGYTSGCGSGRFCPSDPVTRGQMAVFLLRGEHGMGYAPPANTPQIFADVPVGADFYDWINQLAREGVTAGCGGGNYCPTAAVNRAQMAVFLTAAFGLRGAGTTSPVSNHRFHLYDSDYHLLTETARTTAAAPAWLYEYIWFNGQPVAQEVAGGLRYYITTDHLGTPFLLTNASKTTVWRAEYEPYGRVFSLRGGDQHQPLRLPGQEAEQWPDIGMNGASERFYNIFRWYRPNWGRYTQPDPIGLQGGLNLFGYALGNPVLLTDEDGTTPSSVVDEATCFFCTLLAEAGGTSRPCQRAVASVILNRLSDAKQDDPMASICDVVSKPGAFSGYGNSTYRSCTNCSAPLPGLPALFANLQDGFPPDPKARFYGSRPYQRGRRHVAGWNYFERRQCEGRTGPCFTRVPYPPCPSFRFYNERGR